MHKDIKRYMARHAAKMKRAKKMKRLKDSGLSLRAIGEREGCSYERVRQLIALLGG